MKKQIILTWAEVAYAAQAGIMRHVVNERDKRKSGKITPKKSAWGIHAEGALGEYAVAKLLNKHWKPHLKNFHMGDLGGEFQVEIRHTVHYGGHLLVKCAETEEALTRPFILVTGNLGSRNEENNIVFTCHGWIIGAHGQREEWKRTAKEDGRLCYFVPQSVLRPIDQLPTNEKGLTE